MYAAIAEEPSPQASPCRARPAMSTPRPVTSSSARDPAAAMTTAPSATALRPM